jgi:anthranilate phosphoribosyltransferase
MTQDHPFTAYMRIIGRGATLSRPMTEDEAAAAFGMILDGRCEPVQVGAFLAVLRVRGETPEEIAGFVRATRERLSPAPTMRVDLDWPSYADRHRQQPWFVLAAILLAESGVRVLVHGIAGSEEGYAAIRPVLERLGIAISSSLTDAARHLDTGRVAYVSTEEMCPPLASLFALRPILGVRTAVNSLARALNPADAPAQMIGVFHPPYRALHRRVGEMARLHAAAIFTGGAGEAQRNPLKACKITFVHDGVASDEEWPPMLPDVDYRWRDEDLDPRRVAALWRGEIDLPAPVAAIIGTTALALHVLGKAANAQTAHAMAEDMWVQRPRRKYAVAA